MIMNNSSWMALLPDETPITKINMPGTHDSAACFVAFSFISRTQKLSVPEQLEAGVRYFDFRFNLKDDKFYASHSIAKCKTKKGLFAPKMTADDVVAYCTDFLKRNQGETILFQLKETVSHTGNDFFTLFYKKYIEKDSERWYIKNRIPALGEARGKIVLLRVTGIDKEAFNDDNSGIDFSGYPYVGTRNVDDWRKSDICSVVNSEAYAKMLVQDSYKVEGKKKWGTVVRFFDNKDKCDFNICLTSCTFIFVPGINVKYINRCLKKFSFTQGRNYGIIASDFIDNKICYKIINSNTISAV